MSDDFFSGVEQIDGYIGDFKGKAPAFYRGARCFGAVFPARLSKLRKLLPDRRFVPAQMIPGMGALQLMALEYSDTDIGPYNEFAVEIPLNSPHFLQVPVYNSLRQMAQMSFHSYFLHLPVTTEVARKGGVDFYNFPKFLASINFTDSEEWITCELEENGELICRLQGRRLPAERNGKGQTFCYTYQNGQLQVAESKMNARQYSMSFKPSDVRLELSSSHPIANEISSLLLTTKPLIYTYFPDLQLILFGGEHITLGLIMKSLEEGMHIPLRSLVREKEMAEKR